MLSSITTGLATGWRNLLAPDLAIDLGTANTRLYARGHGLIADEPTLIKIQPETGVVEAVGARAARLSKLDQFSYAISPLHAGAVADIEAASSLLKFFLARAQRLGILRPRDAPGLRRSWWFRNRWRRRSARASTFHRLTPR